MKQIDKTGCGADSLDEVCTCTVRVRPEREAGPSNNGQAVPGVTLLVRARLAAAAASLAQPQPAAAPPPLTGARVVTRAARADRRDDVVWMPPALSPLLSFPPL